MGNEPKLPAKTLFDYVIFNFPHTGEPNYKDMSLQSNQSLLRGIFASVPYIISPNGELHITLKNEPIYNSWKIDKQCEQVFQLVQKTKFTPLCLKNRFSFEENLFVGYTHVATATRRSVSGNENFVWVFGPKSKSWLSPKLQPTGPLYTNGLYKCVLCDVTLKSKKRLEIHLAGRAHRGRVENGDGDQQATGDGATKKQIFSCPSCRPVVRCNNQKNLDEHLKSKKHLKKLKSQAKQLKRKRKTDEQ